MTRVGLRPFHYASVGLPLLLALSGCMGGGAPSAGSTPQPGLFAGLFGPSTSVTPVATPTTATAEAPVDVECPKVEIRDGGANVRQSADKAVRVQFSIRNVARECSVQGESLMMKIGIEGIALIGSAGKPGPVSAPLTITAIRGDKTLVNRTALVKTVIPADDEQALFRLIEDGIKIPLGKGELSVTVGFKG
jgi:hypothetical protein